MDKSPEAFRTISEVAEDMDLPQHVLRFWETRFPQIKPLKRGGGRRYYRPDDIELLHRGHPRTPGAAGGDSLSPERLPARYLVSEKGADRL